MIELLNPTTNPLAYFRIYKKSLKGVFINNYQHILMGYFLNSNVDLERVSMHKHRLLKLLEKWRQILD